MYYEYEENEFEPSEADQEKMAISDSTEVKKKNDRLVINADMTIFAEGIVDAVVHKVKREIYNQVLEEVKREIVDMDLKRVIQTSVGDIIKDLILDFMNNEKIKVGGDFWNDIPAEEMTMIQYAKRCLKEAIEKESFKIVTDIKPASYGSGFNVTTKEFTFQDYIKSNLGIGNEMQEYLNRQIGEIKKNVNKDMQNLFDKSTKEMLSESVLNVLMANETYGRIRNQVGQIADRSVN